MINIGDAKIRILKKYTDKAIETSSENNRYFIFSLRHKTMPRGAATGGACYLVDKRSGEIIVCGITDPRTK